MEVPAGSPSRGGNVKVCVLDINQPSLPTPFTLFLCLFLSYGPFTCISFHKFSRQLSVFSLCSPSLISASLVLWTIYLFVCLELWTRHAPVTWCRVSPWYGRYALKFSLLILSLAVMFLRFRSSISFLCGATEREKSQGEMRRADMNHS